MPISTRSFRPFAVALLLATAGVAVAATSPTPSTTVRPKVLLILPDQHSADAMRCWQGDHHHLRPPNLVLDPAFTAVINEHRRLLLEWSRTTRDASFPFIAPQ